jgi:FkbH-like protein
MIGDCLQLDTISSMVGPCAAEGIEIAPIHQDRRIPTVLLNQLSSTYGPDAFDIIFLSPFSYSFLPEYESLISPRTALWSRRRLEARTTSLLGTVESLASNLLNRFACPLFIHNAAAITQTFQPFSGRLKQVLTFRNRRATRQLVATGLEKILKTLGDSFEGRVQLIDEESTRRRHSDFKLSRVLLDSHAYHPTLLGVSVGRDQYADAVFACTRLAKRKVIVCDLDNTLWEGVIGEGPVLPYNDRQAVLRSLRHRGVVLSINSKNDPANVNWESSLLKKDDFVAPQINWRHKTENIATISAELNIKTKDFVFIDDRKDELARVAEAFPEMVTLDATHPGTWLRLKRWHDLLPREPSEDRTRLYHERASREEFLRKSEAVATRAEDDAAALAGLELTFNIESVKRSGLKRAVELINRTNQFNLTGARTTLRELETGLGETHVILAVDAADKFGSMGVVGIVRVDLHADRLEVPIFVLSCRAFGFGIELALLGSLRSLCTDARPIVGLYQETPLNGPGRDLYPRAGFSWDGTRWLGSTDKLPACPVWLHGSINVAPPR